MESFTSKPYDVENPLAASIGYLCDDESKRELMNLHFPAFEAFRDFLESQV